MGAAHRLAWMDDAVDAVDAWSVLVLELGDPPVDSQS